MVRAIQITENAKTWDEAYEMLRALAIQIDYLGGHVLAPNSVTHHWRIQAFVEDTPHCGDMWLPDGCRRSLVPNRIAKQLGFAVNADAGSLEAIR